MVQIRRDCWTNLKQYCIKCKTTSRITLRNRRHIKPLPTPPSQTEPHPTISTGTTPNLTGKELGNQRNLTSSGSSNSSPTDNHTDNHTVDT